MSKKDKLIKKLQSNPPPKDFTWNELIKVLKHFGFEIISSGKTGGSRRKFMNKNKVIISLHEPHPSKELKRYQIEQVVELLKQERCL